MTKIQVLPYDPVWPQIFEAEAAIIHQALGENCLKIHHIGSTSVSGLTAKPIIDMIPVVKDILQVDQRVKFMEEKGFEAKGEYGIPFRRFFSKKTPNSSCNVHIYEKTNPEIERHLKFRDWMRSHKEDAQAYATLKELLALKYPEDIYNYCLGKSSFIAEILIILSTLKINLFLFL